MLRVEADCMHESIRFLRKDPTKKTLIAFLGAASLVKPSRGMLVRSVYYFFRGLDDMLDGEFVGRAVPSDPKGYAEDIKNQIVTTGHVQPKDRITRLGNYAVPRLFRRAGENDDVSGSIATIIDEMVFDHDRRETHAVSTAARLRQNYARGLNESLNLLFVSLGSPIRSGDIGDYSFAQGRLYSARDLEKDWGLGIINVPSEILVDQAHMTPQSAYSELIANVVITDWLDREVACGITDMKKSLTQAEEFFRSRSRGIVPDMGLIVLKGLGSGILRSSVRK